MRAFAHFSGNRSQTAPALNVDVQPSFDIWSGGSDGGSDGLTKASRRARRRTTYAVSDVMRTELAMLEEMLDAIEPGRVIERASVQARRDRLREELASLLGQGERHWVQTELSGD